MFLKVSASFFGSLCLSGFSEAPWSFLAIGCSVCAVLAARLVLAGERSLATAPMKADMAPARAFVLKRLLALWAIICCGAAGATSCGSRLADCVGHVPWTCPQSAIQQLARCACQTSGGECPKYTARTREGELASGYEDQDTSKMSLSPHDAIDASKN